MFVSISQSKIQPYIEILAIELCDVSYKGYFTDESKDPLGYLPCELG